MYDNINILCFLTLMLCPFLLTGQNNNFSTGSDTLFIYETVIEYDTLVVYDTLRVTDDYKLNKIEPKSQLLNMLQYDKINNIANLLIISGNETATIPLNNIILNENIKNFKSMKKLSFVGVVLFAFQSMVMSQTNYGISAGTGIWWVNTKSSDISVEYSPMFNTGVFFKQPLKNSFYLQADLNYSYLQNNNNYKNLAEPIHWFVPLETLPDYDFHRFSLPIKLGYSLGKFNPFLGLEYSFRLSESWSMDQKKSFGFVGGLDYKINDMLSVSLNYYNGLSKDYTDDYISIEYYNFWKSSNVGISLHYSLSRNKNKDI